MNIAIALLVSLQLPSGDTLALSLPAARARALRANPTLRAERADARAAAQRPREASRAFLPTISAEAQGVRSTDPVAVFGMKLRQERFAAGDLALDALNRPSAAGDYTARLSIEQPLVAPEAWYAHAAAERAAAAQAAALRRATGATILAATRAYWDAQLAARRVAALDTGLAAARAHAARAEALRDQGLVSGLDARLARLRAAQLDAQRVDAQADAENALAALRALLALPDSTLVIPTDPLTVGSSHELPPPAGDLSGRGDLQALAFGTRAAALGVRRAWAANLPSLAAFANVAQHSPIRPFGAGSADWTVGVGLVWRPFAGLAGVGAVARARAERDAAAARLEAAEHQARLEVARAERLHAAALRRTGVARDARAEAAEALTQAQLRYRTGTAPITELLDVQAALTSADLDLLTAQHDVLVARALLDFANGVNDQ